MKWYYNIWFYVAAALLCIATYAYYTSHVKARQYVRWQQQKNDSLRYYKDKQGNTHAIATVQQIPAKLYKHIADSIIQAVAKNTKAKDLVQHSEIRTTTTHRDTVRLRDTVILAGADSIPAQLFNYNDNALNLTGLLYNGHADVNYTFNLHLGHTTKWHRPGLFKKKVLIVDAYSLTPYTNITGMQAFVIQQPPKKFYETKAFAVLVGAAVGFAAGTAK